MTAILPKTTTPSSISLRVLRKPLRLAQYSTNGPKISMLTACPIQSRVHRPLLNTSDASTEKAKLVTLADTVETTIATKINESESPSRANRRGQRRADPGRLGYPVKLRHRHALLPGVVSLVVQNIGGSPRTDRCRPHAQAHGENRTRITRSSPCLRIGEVVLTVVPYGSHPRWIVSLAGFEPAAPAFGGLHSSVELQGRASLTVESNHAHRVDRRSIR